LNILKQNGRILFQTLILFFLLLQQGGFTQIIPNGNFEEWHTGRHRTPEPDSWETQNETGFVTVSPGPGRSGQNSACLSEQWDSMTQSFRGTAMTNTFGMPASNNPWLISGWIKGSPSNSDSLLVSVKLFAKKVQVGSESLSIFTATTDWKSFSLMVNPGSNLKTETALITVSLESTNSSHYQSLYCIDDLSVSETK
jgi:hypothetical protein